MDKLCRAKSIVEIASQSKIRSIKSPSHSLAAVIDSAEMGQGPFVGRAEFAGQRSDMDRDLVVLIEPVNPHDPTVFIEQSDDHPALVSML